MMAENAGPNLETIGAPEILDALADGAYITDSERRILFWSRAAERITGWSAAEVVGHKCSDNILDHMDKDGRPLCGQESCPLHRAIVTGTISQEPLLVYARHKLGHRVPVEVSVAPLRDRTGATIGGVEIFRDWTNVLEDLQRAKVIQDHALESEVLFDPRLEVEVRYSPEDLVGGDFYRIERLGPDTYALLLADVMGHGIAAALYTMQLRSLWEECRCYLASPRDFASAINSRLYRLTKADGYFATAAFLNLDLHAGCIRYVNAGHPAPLLFQDRSQILRLDLKSPALGLIEAAPFRESQAHFRKGDSLLLYTDGATEVTGADGNDLGEAGVIRLVQSAPTGWQLSWLETKLLEASNEIRLPDDLTFIKVTRPT